MAAESQLAIVREVLSACNSREYDEEIAERVPAMLKVLSQNLFHADRRVRSAVVAGFGAMVKNYRDCIDVLELSEFDRARSVLSENQNEGDGENFELLNSALVQLGMDGGEYLDCFMQPEYADEHKPSRIHGMILRLGSVGKSAISRVNPGVLQMRMVLVPGVISASFKIEENEAAEDETVSSIGKIYLSVKVPPVDDAFVNDLNKAIIDGTDKLFKLENIDFWENAKAEPEVDKYESKSTEFAESEKNDDDGMYLDDDEKLASRATGKKRSKKPARPWSMFNPSSALGLNSVFNSTDLLEMVEYDAEEAEETLKRKQEEEEMQEAAPAPATRFGLFRRLFG